MALGAHQFQPLGEGIEGEVHGVNKAPVVQVGGGNDWLLTGLPRHLPMGAHLVLVACHQQVTVTMQQRGWLVLLEAHRMLLHAPRRATVVRVQGNQFLRILVVLIHFAEPVTKNQKTTFWVIQDAWTDIDDGMLECVFAQRLRKMFPRSAGVLTAKHAVVVHRHHRAIARRADGV